MAPLTKYGQWLVFSATLWTHSFNKNKVKVLLLTSESLVTYNGQVGLNPKQNIFPLLGNTKVPLSIKQYSI